MGGGMWIWTVIGVLVVVLLVIAINKLSNKWSCDHALSEAEVGIAMGTGTDVAMQSAGVTLVKGDLRGIAKAIRLSRATMRNIRENLFFAFLYNALGIPLAAGAWKPMPGSYKRALSSTFFPELLSMNCLMAGMVPAMTLAMKSAPASHIPSGPAFWFIMSMALLVGFITAYPMNWWLVSRHMKHGMMTVRPLNESVNGEARKTMHDDHSPSERTGAAQPTSKPPMDDDANRYQTASSLGWQSFRLWYLG